MSEAAEQLEAGDVLDGRYELISELGVGGFSVVYKARQISTGQLVALKVLKLKKLARAADADIQKARFEREMQLIAQLKHPNIVRLIDTGFLDDGRNFMVLEFIEGEDLHELLQSGGPLTVREAKHLMFQVMDALSSAHSLGIVHRDLKPQNIMITTMGYRRNAMVLDFGIAAVLSASRGNDYKTLTRGSQIHGTPAYMAPEQLKERRLTSQIDVYAWGLVFLECLVGRRIIVGESPLDIAIQQVTPEPIPIPEELNLPEGLEAIITKALAKHLSDRYQSANEVLAALDNFSDGSSSQWPAFQRSDSGVLRLPDGQAAADVVQHTTPAPTPMSDAALGMADTSDFDPALLTGAGIGAAPKQEPAPSGVLSQSNLPEALRAAAQTNASSRGQASEPGRALRPGRAHRGGDPQKSDGPNKGASHSGATATLDQPASDFLAARPERPVERQNPESNHMKFVVGFVVVVVVLILVALALRP